MRNFERLGNNEEKKTKPAFNLFDGSITKEAKKRKDANLRLQLIT